MNDRLFRIDTQFFCEVQQGLLNNSVLKLLHMNPRGTDLHIGHIVGESTLGVSEQTVGKTSYHS